MKKVFFYLMLVAAVLFTACEELQQGTGNGTNNGGTNNGGTNNGTIDAATVMTLNPSDLVMVVGSQKKIRPVLNPAPTVDYNVLWTSSDPAVATVKNGDVTAIADGVATITAQIEGTEIKATANVKVANAYEAAEFYDVQLWNLQYDEDENVCEYPFKGYYLDEETGDTLWTSDANGDGKDDVVRECYLYVFGKGIYTDDTGLTGSSDYLILVNSAALYDGTYYYCIGDYKFSDDETVYKREHEGVKYMRSGYATYTHFKPESYCKYYENAILAANQNMSWPSTQEEYDQFMAEYGYWLGDRDSYLYYFVNDGEEDPYMSLAGLVTGGDGFEWSIADENTGATYLSYMDLDFAFFDNTAMGFATEVNEEAGTLDFVVPFEMAPYYTRTISFDNRTAEVAAPVKSNFAQRGRISEKQVLANRAMNVALKFAFK